MTAGNPPPGYPSSPNAPPPPPIWTPPPPSHTRGVSISLESMGTWAFIVGFLLLFVGAIVVAGWVAEPGSCVTTPTSCDANHYAGVLNAIWAAKILWVLGLSGISAGAGIKLHWGTPVQRGASPEEYTWAMGERRRYLFLFVIGIVMLMIVVLTMNSLPLGTVPGLP